MPANVIWGVMLVVVITASAVWLPLAALVVLLSVPTAGIYRMAVLIQRGHGATFGDFIDGARRWALPALGLGSAATLLAFVFTANIYVGLQMGGVVGWLFSALALYADIGLAMFLVAAWPIMVDPLRQELPLRRRLWLAVVVNLARPARMAALTLVLGTLAIVSTVLLAALLTISVAYVGLVSARYVLPAIDRLEGRPSVPPAE